MTTRSNDTTLTFSKAFALSEVDRPLPADELAAAVEADHLAA